jgi:hypothetical protein
VTFNVESPKLITNMPIGNFRDKFELLDERESLCYRWLFAPRIWVADDRCLDSRTNSTEVVLLLLQIAKVD